MHVDVLHALILVVNLLKKMNLSSLLYALVANNMVAEILSNPIEVEMEIENQELLVNDESCIESKHMNAEEEFVNCRSLNEELTSKIGAFELEIQKKEHKIRKLELDVSKLKFSSFKPPKKLSIANVQRTDIPPSFP